MALFRVTTASFPGAAEPSTLSSQSWDFGIRGVQTVDARSRAANDFVSSHTTTSSSVCYNLDKKQFEIEGALTQLTALGTNIRGKQSVLVDATSLNCPELLWILRSAQKEKLQKVSFLYLEPVEYQRRAKGTLTDRRDFDLSDNRRFQAVHGYSGDLSDTPAGTAVFFLGYEHARMGQALEQEELLVNWTKHAVFGVPAFQPGWEIDSLANNVHHLKPGANIQYANAASVEAAYRLLTELKRDDKAGNTIIVVPLGTKPHTIACSMFLIEHNAHDEVLLLYDHPERSKDRSKDIMKWHLYDVYFND